MYILDAETGENATEPTYVGAKDDIRKVEDGILLIQEDSKSDAVMKTDLLGKVKWTVNSKADMAWANIQIPDDNYRIFYADSETYTERVLVLSSDGTVIYDAESF